MQEIRSEGVLAALRNMASPRALVVRDGLRKRIAGREVVGGDLVVLAEGDRIPADIWLTEGSELLARQAQLKRSVPRRIRLFFRCHPSCPAAAHDLRPIQNA